MIDFTNCEINKFKYYGGKNGGKICIKYNDEDYMLKFPGINEGIFEHGYSNNCISEHVACNIIKTLGLKVQETILGVYSLNGTEKVVVACKDFTSDGTVLKQFAELKNSQIETSKNGYGTELEEVIETIEEQQIYDTIDGLKKENPSLRVYLGASKNKEKFYERFGFVNRIEADLGDGMILRDRKIRKEEL